MIKGKVRIDLTAENILKLVSDFDIFRYFMPNTNWKINEATNSPFRKDVNPSFLIGNRNGYLSFVDFADSNKHGDAFEFVKQLHGCTYDEALRIVDKEMGLGISDMSNVGEYKKIVSTYKQPEEDKEKHTVMIQVITKKFTKEDLNYWGEYYIDVQDLRDNHVYSIEKVFLNRKRFPTKDNELKFSYLFGDKWKIYFPKREKKKKWLCNVPLTTSWGLKNLDKDHNSIIAKSLKDYMVCRKVYPHITGIQNESISACSYEFVQSLKDNSKTIFYSGDSDSAGKSASYMITNAFGFKHINPPDRLLPDIKDMSDWARVEGLVKLNEHFIKKGVYEK